mgnify:CR=1 FL=1
MADAPDLVDLEIKLAYQERLIGELDTLVRTFGARLDAAERELRALKAAVRSPEGPVGAANEPPPHY